MLLSRKYKQNHYKISANEPDIRTLLYQVCIKSPHHFHVHIRPSMNIIVFDCHLQTFLLFQGASSPRWEPQISVLCEPGQGQIYHPQFLSEEGRWVTDLSIKTPVSTCLRDKNDLLDYCKKVSGFHCRMTTSLELSF